MDYADLIEAAAKTNLPLILSTGFSNYSEIKNSVELIKKYSQKLIIMHCVGNYPLHAENANLLVIPELIKKFGCITGFSDHSIGGHLSCAAAALGARVFEKHFTTSRKLGFIDNPMSTEPDEFKKMTGEINDIISGLGKGCKNLEELKCEKPIKFWARRAVYAATDIKRGEKFSSVNLIALRPLKKGFPVFNMKKLLGCKSARDYKKDAVITQS